MGGKRILIYTGAVAGITGCVADIISFFVFASKYPGYNQVSEALSNLGSSISPVSHQISVWWIAFGIMIIVFALGFGIAYSHGGKFVKLAAWCIFFYGLGEGIGSGLFKFDLVNNVKTFSYSLHEVFGTIGVFGILALPFIILKTDIFGKNQRFRKFTRVILITGTLFFVLFSIRYININNPMTDLINKFTGLWQRMFLSVYYVYLVAISIRMIKDTAVS
jgi:hypothetical protein